MTKGFVSGYESDSITGYGYLEEGSDQLPGK